MSDKKALQSVAKIAAAGIVLAGCTVAIEPSDDLSNSNDAAAAMGQATTPVKIEPHAKDEAIDEGDVLKLDPESLANPNSENSALAAAGPGSECGEHSCR